ncbi:hypothetical protein VKT23_019821 [Stygiomarasmius scandens]|uniref:Uncharacterized protein n=1 Tax=Marasmiellus scandens TaxID=2682957 RepID=A0ABR1IKP1_9AGAR
MVAGSNAGSDDSGRSRDTLLPGDSVSQVSSRESGTVLSSLARNNVDFERYLTATQCVYELDNLLSDQDPMSEKAKQIKEILGELPERPSARDLSLLYVAQCLEQHVAQSLASSLRKLNKEQEQALQCETEKLYRTWELRHFHPDLEVIRERLKPAALITVQPQIRPLERFAGRIVFLEGLKVLLRTNSPPLQEYKPRQTLAIVSLTAPWENIAQEWQPGIAKRHLRGPVDTLYATIFGGYTFIEHRTIPVSARSQIDKGPGLYFLADHYKTHSFKINKRFLSTHQKLLDLLHWREDAISPASSGQVEIPMLAQEFKTDNFREAANRCAADLISGATINELLDIQFPCYGLVVTLEICGLYAARAQLQPDGTLKYAVQKIDTWGTLKELPNYLKYVKFVEDHKAWFEDNVVSQLIKRRSEEDPEWVIEKLTRANIKPWAHQVTTLAVAD